MIIEGSQSPEEEDRAADASASQPVSEVWGTIYPPCYAAGEDEKLNRLDMDVSDDRYEKNYANFTERGRYTIEVHAQDALGNMSTPPMITHVDTTPWDVNHDKKVNILDLVLVGRYLGESPAQLTNADVNGDGAVDISDLALVGKHFGEKYCIE